MTVTCDIMLNPNPRSKIENKLKKIEIRKKNKIKLSITSVILISRTIEKGYIRPLKSSQTAPVFL